MSSKKLRNLRFFNVAAFAAMVLVNMLAQLIPLGGHSTAMVSAENPSLFTPTGLTFSIWGVIYVLMGYFVIRQFGKRDTALAEDIGMWFVISCALNVAWIISWHFELLILSLAIILALLVTLFVMAARVKSSTWDIRAGFSIYYAWISVAAMANLFVVLASFGGALYNSAFIQAMVVAGMLLAALLSLVRLAVNKDLPYAFTMVWAVLGILIAHIGEKGFGGEYPAIIIAATVSLLVILYMSVSVIAGKMKGNKKRKKLTPISADAEVVSVV